jgi:hypothetical protein
MLLGKGDKLIAGYNTASEEPLEAPIGKGVDVSTHKLSI